MTISEYYDLIILEVKQQPTIATELAGELATYPNAISRMRQLLAQLDSNSQVAIWRLWAFVMAAICWIQAGLWNEAKAEITALANAAIRDTDQAFLREVQNFEYPGTAIVDPDTKAIVFVPSVPENRIIAVSAIITDSLGVSNVLVSKRESGILAPITGAAFTAFVAYLGMIQPVGTNVQGSSRDPDLLKIDLRVFFDPLQTTATQIALDANLAIVASLEKVDFKGRISKQIIEDAIRAVIGCRNLHFVALQARTSVSGSAFADFQDGEYTTIAGYMKPATGTDWTITALPYNV